MDECPNIELFCPLWSMNLHPSKHATFIMGGNVEIEQLSRSFTGIDTSHVLSVLMPSLLVPSPIWALTMAGHVLVDVFGSNDGDTHIHSDTTVEVNSARHVVGHNHNVVRSEGGELLLLFQGLPNAAGAPHPV